MLGLFSLRSDGQGKKTKSQGSQINRKNGHYHNPSGGSSASGQDFLSYFATYVGSVFDRGGMIAFLKRYGPLCSSTVDPGGVGKLSKRRIII